MLESLAYKMYCRTSVGSPYRPKSNWFWFRVWKHMHLRRQAVTKQEVMQEFTLRLLGAVDQCDKEIHMAYNKRQRALAELNEWFPKAYEEATNGEVSDTSE